ncbi:MAG: GuaB3 family IMP dehydrogenase-related protein [Chloroflexi bacterium]|nr:GuaB3 family IMP dehydrogenase-related protein [Chloroflexota bacterium]
MTDSRFRSLRRAYGFDEVAIVPGRVTINPEQTDISFAVGEHTVPLPVLAAAMDAVVDPAFAVALGRLGGLAVLNLEGVQTRYEHPGEVLANIAACPAQEVTSLLQKIYTAPIQERLVGERIGAIKAGGAVCAASTTPASAKRLGALAVEAGADIFAVQSTVTTARHVSKSYRGLIFSELCQVLRVPVLVGNCVSYETATELMEEGISGVLVGVGPGAACTTREVLGIGVPQVTATMDCAAARDDYFRRTGRYVTIITDGGIRTGGDLCKALASGADAVMLGSVFAQTEQAPGQGHHWGMATSHAALPRGTRIKVGITATLEQILFGPTSRTDGTQNLMGALRTAMGVCGAATIKEFHQAEMVVAPAIKTEGKQFQMAKA